MNWMIRIYHKYRLEIRYLFFGVLTTIVNYASFAAALWLLGTSATLVANAVSFVLATAFAYVTNKRFVFRSPGWRPSVIAHEFAAFTGARLFSFALEELGLLIGVQGLGVARYEWLGINGVLILKVILSFLSVLLNYLFSRYWIFRKK